MLSLELLLLVGIREKADLHEGRGHANAHQDHEGGLFDATRPRTSDLGQLRLGQLREFARFEQVFRFDQVPENGCQGIVRIELSNRRPESLVLAFRSRPRGVIRCVEAGEIRFDTMRFAARRRIGMNREEEIRSRVIGHRGPPLE